MKNFLNNLTPEQRKTFENACNDVLATNPDFDSCLNEADKKCREIIALDLGNRVNKLVHAIAGNLIVMAAIYYDVTNKEVNNVYSI